MKKHSFRIIIFTAFFLIVCMGIFFCFYPLKRPLVSVVMPVYNRPDLLPRSIESILNQTFPDFEFIIVDDGSDTKTKEVLRQYAQKDSRIRLIQNPINRGIAYSRQQGLEAARGKYVAIMDSDDWSVPERLEKSIAFMSDYPEIDAMSGGIQYFSKDFSPSQHIPNKRKYSVSFVPGFYEIELMFYNIFPNVAALFKRDFVLQNHIQYNTAFVSAEDYDFWRQIIMNGGKLGSISDTLVFVRSHSSNSQTYYNAMTTNSIKIHQNMISRFFVPQKNELKFEYSLMEKCHILYKIKNSNSKNPQIPQVYIDNRYETICPFDLENTYYLINPLYRWEDFLEQIGPNLWKRKNSPDTGKIVKVGEDKIDVFWTKYPKETFFRLENGIWTFVPEGRTIKLKHPYWSADFIISDTHSYGCRTDVKTECAHVQTLSDGSLELKWINPAWDVEIFKKIDETTYELTE